MSSLRLTAVMLSEHERELIKLFDGSRDVNQLNGEGQSMFGEITFKAALTEFLAEGLIMSQ